MTALHEEHKALPNQALELIAYAPVELCVRPYFHLKRRIAK